ncbi:MAG: biotin--[acetyl-CoA-carboxylase] ligase [Candidatus Adiutrix sp.]|jgi:BirA family biotin operon repressor/biotin-[acetyl-CoA-carboxylase] ligase|nr:biotin--[acetyl-CoA-carboxylase] ligase [Candidatus Adiutrix sp.]
MAGRQLPVWGAVLMERQTAGRGRMGRVWQSPPGHIYGALRLPAAPPFDGPGASLALAFFVIESLADRGWELNLKWPNDLIYQGGKAGGILLEARPAGLVAGVGLNLTAPPEGEWRLTREIGAPPPAALPARETPAALWAALVKKIILLYNEQFEGATMADLIPEMEKRLWWRGQPVIVERPASDPPAPAAGPFGGRIEGLGPEGQLRLVNDQGRYQLWSGTVFLAQ